VSKRWPDKTVIGLTGNIATGKSVVRRMLEHLGAFGIDADGLAHRAMSPGAPAYKPIVEWFGRWVLAPSGQIDRGRLGRIVFSEPEALAILEDITHPIVVEVVDLLIRRAKQPVVVIEAIKLFESGLAGACDAVWVVDAPREARIERLVSVRGLAERAARLRVDAQPPQEDKIARAARVIDNNGTYLNTYDQVQRGLSGLIGREQVEVEAEPAAPARPAPRPEAAVAAKPTGELVVQRAMMHQAPEIAAFIRQVHDRSSDDESVRRAFGEKAYMLARMGDSTVGLAGWQVENLITRVDEFYVASNAPLEDVAHSLLDGIERAASDLQSEVALLFLPGDAPDGLHRVIQAAGYEDRTPSDLRVPDWRQAAEESAPPGSDMLFKRLREDRILRPI
jgi:dephospho-CoA kinase